MLTSQEIWHNRQKRFSLAEYLTTCNVENSRPAVITSSQVERVAANRLKSRSFVLMPDTYLIVSLLQLSARARRTWLRPTSIRSDDRRAVLSDNYDFQGTTVRLALDNMMTAIEVLEALLMNKPCSGRKAGHLWQLRFGEGGATLNLECPWKLLSEGRIAYGGDDDGQQFGLPEPIDAPDEVNAARTRCELARSLVSCLTHPCDSQGIPAQRCACPSRSQRGIGHASLLRRCCLRRNACCQPDGCSH